MIATIEQARDAKPHVLKAAREHAQVVGAGLARCGESFAVKINLGAAPVDFGKLPREMFGVPVLYEVIGRIRPRTVR